LTTDRAGRDQSVCPTCAVGVGFDEDASALYGEMYVRCVPAE
jgi:hypothetical protein